MNVWLKKCHKEFYDMIYDIHKRWTIRFRQKVLKLIVEWSTSFVKIKINNFREQNCKFL